MAMMQDEKGKLTQVQRHLASSACLGLEHPSFAGRDEGAYEVVGQ